MPYTSDDWIVADLISESAMVHPPIISGVLINPSTKQDQPSPKTTDPVAEDDPQSLPFASICTNVLTVQATAQDPAKSEHDSGSNGERDGGQSQDTINTSREVVELLEIGRAHV